MAERPEACTRWQPALAGWLVAQLAPDEEAALRAHLDSCARCRAEADSLLAVAATSLGVGPTWAPSSAAGAPAPEALGDRIASAIRQERRRARRVRPAAMAGLAAAVVAVVVAVAVRDGGGGLDGTPVEFAVVPAGARAAAVVAPEADGSIVALTASGLDPAVTYALWLTPPGGGYEDRLPAGTFRPDASGRVDVRLPCALPADQAGRVWATTSAGDVALDTEPAHRRSASWQPGR